MMQDPSKSNKIEQCSTSDPSAQLVINYDGSDEQNQGSPNGLTTCAEPDQSLQQPTAHKIHDQLVDDCGVEAQSFKPKVFSAVINIEQSHVAAPMEIEDTQEYSLTNADSISSLDYALITS